MSPTYTEDDLRDAFREGWKTRDRTPGLKKVRRNNVHNHIMAGIGAGNKNMQYALIPDHRKYHNGIWLRSQFRKQRIAS